jgi:hypothetical protein
MTAPWPALSVSLPLSLTTGCATQSAYLNEGPTALGKPPYQVGPVTVVICPHGCYVPADRLIVWTADPCVLMHEFKHSFEGPWHK